MLIGKETRNKILAQVNTKDSGKKKSLIPTFGKHTIMITNKPKVGLNFWYNRNI